MASLTKVMILFCGQGMTTLVEVYNDGKDTHAADHLVLIDCGGNQRWADHATDYITLKLKQQTAPKLDAVVISHQDGDHLTLLKALGTKLEGMNAQCGPIFAGGTRWSSTNKSTVKKFAKVVDVNEMDIEFESPYQSDYSDVDEYKNLGWLSVFGDVYIRVLISGLKISKGAEDIVRNASSAVMVVENGTGSVILPGDATYQTMKEVNTILASDAGKLLPKREGFEVPHHGALRTAVENYDAKKDSSDFDWTIVRTFADHLAPMRVMASAGPRNSHCHPVEEVLVVFEGSTIDVTDHNYVSYVFDKAKSSKHEGWEQFTVAYALHATVQQIEGTILWGDLEVRLAAPGVLRPEEVVRFHPRGTVASLFQENPHTGDIIYAPAP